MDSRKGMTADNIMYQREQYQSASLSHVAGLRLRAKLLGRMQAKILTARLRPAALLLAACGSQPAITSGSGTTPGAANTSTSGGGGQPAGTATEFPLPASSGIPQAITAGLDGNLWFTECTFNSSSGKCTDDRIGRITPGGQITEFPPLPTPGSEVQHITAGPDGNLWFTEQDGNKIGRITP
jgi:streptogramin lyase